MSPDDKDKKGPETTGKGGSKDLDELKKKLGLKKPAPGRTPGTPPREQPKRTEAEDFKFSFGQAAETPGMSAEELAAIERDAGRATTPIGKYVVISAIGLIAIALFLFLGYQFGSSMGQRVLHNAAVEQGKEIREFFLKKFSSASGEELDSRRDATTQFVLKFDEFHEANITELTALVKTLSEGEVPPDFDLKKMFEEQLAPLKKTCKDFLSNVEEYSVGAILRGQLYSTELGAKLLEFVDRTNKLRARVENLYVTLELVESFALTGGLPANLKPEVLILADKPESEKEKVPYAPVVELSGKPEMDKELVTKEICEPISMELEIPICDARRGEPETEKRLIDVFDKREVQEVKQFRKVRVKTADEGKPMTARLANLFKLDLKPFLKPLLERIGQDKKQEAENLGLIFSTLVQDMNDVRLAGETVDFQDVLDSVEKFAGQEKLFTF